MVKPIGREQAPKSQAPLYPARVSQRDTCIAGMVGLDALGFIHQSDAAGSECTHLGGGRGGISGQAARR